MPRKGTKKAAPRNKGVEVFKWKGVTQVGDAALYGDNPKAYYTQYHVPVNAVGPGDIVDDIDPAKRYTFYLFEPTSNAADAARERDRLRRAGWFKCEAPRFISPTEKFETRDGALVLGQATWYALPYSKKLANRKAARDEMGPQAVAQAHASLADSARAELPGFDANAEVRGGELGQRR